MTQIKQTKSAYFKEMAKKPREEKSEMGKELGAVIENKKETYPVIGEWKGKLFTVKNKCIGCEMCIKHCPEAAIIMKEVDGKKQAEIDAEFCKGCGICANICPVSAIDTKSL